MACRTTGPPPRSQGRGAVDERPRPAHHAPRKAAAFGSSLQILPEAPHEPHFDKTEGAVGRRADLVVRRRVRRELATAVRTSPFLPRPDQRSTHAAPPRPRDYEPSLQIR